MKARMSASKFFFPALFAFSLIFAPFTASAQDDSHVAVRILPAQTQVKGGETIKIGIEHTIAPGWHTYWLNPGDSGTPARISWAGIDGLKASAIEWPVPKKLPMGPLTNFGYEDNVVLLQDLTLPDTIPGEPTVLTATVEILVCQEICIPETHQKSFVINGDEEAVPVAVAMAQTRLPLDTGWEATLSEGAGNLTVTIETDQPQAFAKTGTIEIYPEEWGLILNPEKTQASIDGNKLILQQKRGERKLEDVPPGKIIVAYEDTQGTRKGVRVSALSDLSTKHIEQENVSAPEGMSLIKAALLALIGGIILNLMPCVFPILSMKALSLVQLKDEDNAKARWHGLFYTLGVLFSFAVIAAILLSLKAGGAEIGWGFQLQNPVIILGLSYLFFILGLNLAGYFEISFGLSNIGTALTQRAGLSGSFFTGVLATVVATPCTAPFMATAIGYAITQSAGTSIAVFLSLGFGLALPYLLLTMIPALRHVLPRPGAWMETFRQFLAFPMFASTLWLIWVLSQQVGSMQVFNALLSLLAIAFGVWLWKAKPLSGAFRFVVMALAVATFIFAIGTLVTISESPLKPVPVAASGSESLPFTQTALDEALKSGKPVFVNMTAAWCITCKVNEKIALNTERTKALFAGQQVQYFKGDWTNQNPEITKFLESYGRSGVPIYVYYNPGHEAVVLPQILTPDIIEKTILGDPDA